MDENTRLNYFQTFLTVARTHSFSVAAKELRTSQGTVSNHIAALEKQFEAELFKRTAKGVEVTDAGLILKETAEKILADIETAKARISSAKHTLAGVIKIAASTIPEEHILPGLIAEFRNMYPDVKFKIKAEDSIMSLLSLQNNNADFAAVGTIHGYSENFDAIEVGADELVLIVPKNHALAKRKLVKLNALLGYPYINREETSGTRKEIEKLLEASGTFFSKLKTALELGSTESVITAVSEGRGISIISSIASKKAQAAGLVKTLKIDVASTSRKLYMVRPKRTLLKISEVFWDFCRGYTSRKS